MKIEDLERRIAEVVRSRDEYAALLEQLDWHFCVERSAESVAVEQELVRRMEAVQNG
jgi:hypothetical protein